MNLFIAIVLIAGFELNPLLYGAAVLVWLSDLAARLIFGQAGAKLDESEQQAAAAFSMEPIDQTHRLN